MKEKICCPKCNGVGLVNIPIKRMKSQKSVDPNLRWCLKCSQFLNLSHFYLGKGYCKKCDINRQRLRKIIVARKRKYDAVCSNCSARYFAYTRHQMYCSRECNCIAMSKKKMIKAYGNLPNELRDQIINEDFI